MARKWASGKHSYAICERSGFKIRYQDLKEEWNGLRVDKRIWEFKHEQLTPVRVVADPEALRDPSPDTLTGATAYVTQTATDYTAFSTWGPTTQLFEAIPSLTFGVVT